MYCIYNFPNFFPNFDALAIAQTLKRDATASIEMLNLKSHSLILFTLIGMLNINS